VLRELHLGCGRWSFSNRNCRCGWRYRVLYDHSYSGRRNCDGRTMCDYSACRSLGNYRVGCGRVAMAGEPADERRWRRGTRLGTILRGSGLAGAMGGGRDGDNRRRWTRRSLGGLRGRTPLRHTALPGLFFLFLFLGQDGFSTSPGLEICDRSILALCPEGRVTLRACLAGGPRSTLKMRAYLVGLIALQ